jgi:hypothetical protein
MEVNAREDYKLLDLWDGIECIEGNIEMTAQR